MASIGAVVLGSSLAIGGAASASPGDVISFASTVMRDCVNASSEPAMPAGTAVTEAQAATVKHFVCSSPDLMDLAGIEWLTSVETIDLSDSGVMDLRPTVDPRLSHLVDVRALRVHRTLPAVPAGQWQSNGLWAPNALGRSDLPASGAGAPLEFDAAHENWRFAAAHVAPAGEETLVWASVYGFAGKMTFFMSGYATQSAYWTAPVPKTQPAAVTVTEGGAASLTASATSNQEPAIQWEQRVPGGAWAAVPAGAGVTGATTPAAAAGTGETTGTLSFAAATVAQSGTEFRAVFTNSVGTAYSNVVTLTVQPVTPPAQPARYTLQPAAKTAEAGGATTFRAEFTSSSAAPTYRWEHSKDGGATWASTDSIPGAVGSVAGVATGANTWATTLDLRGIPQRMNGWLFRSVIKDEVTPEFPSSQAGLVVKALTTDPGGHGHGHGNPSGRPENPVLAHTGTAILKLVIEAGVLVLIGAGVLAVLHHRQDA